MTADIHRDAELRHWLVDYRVTNIGSAPEIDLDLSLNDLGVGSPEAVGCRFRGRFAGQKGCGSSCVRAVPLLERSLPMNGSRSMTLARGSGGTGPDKPWDSFLSEINAFDAEFFEISQASNDLSQVDALGTCVSFISQTRTLRSWLSEI